MNALDALFHLYWQMNTAIFGAFFAFAASLRIARLIRRPAPHATALRWGQMTLGIAISVPLLLSAVPGDRLPSFEFGSFHPEPAEPNAVRTVARSVSDPQAFARSASSSTSNRESQVVFWIRANFPSLIPLLAGLWLFGFSINGAFLGRDLVRLRRLLSEATEIRRLGTIRIVVSDAIAVPFSTRGLRRHWIALPTFLLESRGDFMLAVRHELQHHRQKDTSWAFGIELLRCGFYLNPALLLWKRELIELQEFSCDEALIGRESVSPLEYGSCLVRVAENALGFRAIPVGTAGMASFSRNPRIFKPFLRKRIEMFTLTRPRPQKWAAVWIGTVGILTSFAIARGADRFTRKELAQFDAGPNPGTIVVDENIQRITDSILREAVAKMNATDGFAIVADPHSGKVLALANVDEKKKSGVWALSERMEPASLTKSLVVARTIELGLTTPQETHDCKPFRYGGRQYQDWNQIGWKGVTTGEVIANSSDTCSIQIGLRLGAEGVAKMLEENGFGPAGTARRFPGARAGLLPAAEDPAHPVLVPSVVSGFGFRSTPIEMLQAYGAIANGGKLLLPKSADASDEPEVERQIFSSDTAEKMRGILRQVVLTGTAKGHGESALYTTAGKTATGHSRKVLDIGWMGGKSYADVAQFLGFAPAMKPRIEVYVGIRNPRTSRSGAHGSEHAAPVFRKIVDAVLQSMGVPPDRQSGH